MSKAKFAELLGIARQNIEKTVFQKHSLDTDLLCNEKKEVKATLTIEMGAEKKEQVLRFVFGDNNIEILNK